MKKITIALLCILAFQVSLFATWSIIIIDPKTKEIGIAGASCTSGCAGIGSIIPGNGAIIVQAMSNYNAHAMGRQAIIAGHPIEGILEALREKRFDPEHQQYALMTLKQMDPVTYTGNATISFSAALTANGISVQGNILADENELKAIFDAAVQAQKDSLGIYEILMKALEAGSAAGGDKRCGGQKAQSSFIKVARPGDNADNPYLNLVVSGIRKGGDNAVSVLREDFENWKKKKIKTKEE
jgi:uncharacterized Ntn-hydrolase superfamily protein